MRIEDINRIKEVLEDHEMEYEKGAWEAFSPKLIDIGTGAHGSWMSKFSSLQKFLAGSLIVSSIPACLFFFQRGNDVLNDEQVLSKNKVELNENTLMVVDSAASVQKKFPNHFASAKNVDTNINSHSKIEFKTAPVRPVVSEDVPEIKSDVLLNTSLNRAENLIVQLNLSGEKIQLHTVHPDAREELSDSVENTRSRLSISGKLGVIEQSVWLSKECTCNRNYEFERFGPPQGYWGKPGVVIGAGVDYTLSDKWSLKTGLSLLTTRTQWTGDMSAEKSYPYPPGDELNLNIRKLNVYLELPVGVSFSTGKLGLSAGASAIQEIIHREKSWYTYFDGHKTSTQGEIARGRKVTKLNISAFAGADYKINERIALFSHFALYRKRFSDINRLELQGVVQLGVQYNLYNR
jgi:hypothetical protein